VATGDYRLTGVLAFLIVAVTTAAGWQGGHHPQESAPSRVTQPSGVTQPTLADKANARAAKIGVPSPEPRATPVATASGTPAPKARIRSSCPAAATACVDLKDHLTWLQSDGHITYGPVSMEPGPPGTRQATPRGTFHVQWRAGANYISTEYHVPIPYAVFFAPGGVAFHGGSLNTPSHGCVHLDIGSARYYHDHLPTGAEVVVF
jgi:lipoprotein-anchoring transpeptidase ErfK/SrfK